jgi:hypothetical protein
MPNRILREGVLTSERVNEIADEPAVECTYKRLYSVVDDFGRFTAHPSLVRAALYPLRLDQYTDVEISRHLERCVTARLIGLYRVNGKPYLEVLDFNQRTRAMKSKYPSPDGQADSSGQSSGWHTPVSSTSDDGQVTDIGMSRAVRPRPETETETETETDTEATARNVAVTCPTGDSRTEPSRNLWEEFRDAYPQCKRNVRVEPACRAYVGRIDGVQGEHAKLMDGLRRHIDSDQWARSLRDDGGRFVPSMENFIANGMYNDHPPAFQPEKPGGPKKDAVSSGIEAAMRLLANQEKRP